MVRTSLLWDQILFQAVQEMMVPPRSRIRCAIYTRKSSEEGLEQSFNSLQAQREACEAYIASQRHEGWQVIKTHYDDGGFSGGTMKRPALERLLQDIASSKIDTVVVYKVDRLTRSLADFAKIVEAFDRQGISFVSVTQQFNTTTSMGRLTLNVLLSFAQFEREVTGERIRDKVAASKKKGMWMGGPVPLGYDLRDHQLHINPNEAELVRQIFSDYLSLGCVSELKRSLDKEGLRGKIRVSREGHGSGGASFSRGALYSLLSNRLYRGEVAHRGQVHPGQHEAIIETNLWEKVASQLAQNRRSPRRRGTKHSPGLLTGILFDSRGERYTPTHALKGGRRYRYYTSQAMIQGKENPPTLGRLAAQEVEQVVLARLIALLESPRDLLQLFEAHTVSLAETNQIVPAAKLKSLELGQASVEAQATFLAAALERIIVGESSLEIRVAVTPLTDLLLRRPVRASDASSPTFQNGIPSISLTCDLNVKRRGRDLRRVFSAAQQQSAPRTSIPLIKAVVRANSWMERIVSGEISTLEDLASETGFTKRYVSRTLRSAFLAPDITEMILDGLQAPELTVRSLMGGFPADWPSQRLAFKDPLP
jgi:site-specific DNA recombinase